MNITLNRKQLLLTTLLLLALLCILCLPHTALADTPVYDYDDLETALTAPISDTTIIIMNDISFNGKGEITYAGTQAITIQSAPGQVCRLYRNDNDRLLLSTNNQATLTFVDLAFEGSNDSGGNGGGAVRITGDGIFTNCTFTGNGTTGAGSGGAVYTGGNGTFTNCAFTRNNSAENGGAVYTLGSGTFTNCTFTRNATKDASFTRGGAVYTLGNGTFINCAFADNSTGGEGGAVYVFDGVTLTLQDCDFYGNTAGSALSGGAIDCQTLVANGTNYFADNTPLGNWPDAATAQYGIFIHNLGTVTGPSSLVSGYRPAPPTGPSIPYVPVGVDPSLPTDTLGNPTGLGTGTGSSGGYGNPANMGSEAETTQKVNVYDELTGEEKIDTLAKGTAVTVRGIDGRWATVEYTVDGEQRSGLIDIRYLDSEFKLPLKGTVVAKKTARLYTGEGRLRALRLWYKNGASVKVTGLSGGYYLTSVQGTVYRMKIADVELA